jgi:hypothetical protein
MILVPLLLKKQVTLFYELKTSIFAQNFRAA